MKIKKQNIKIKDLVDQFKDSGEQGVTGYHGKLDIRPAYQREFVYDMPHQIAVIESIKNSFPLNTIYWVDRENGEYEVLDGQQRILSICYYVNNSFSVDGKFFKNLSKQEKEQILSYPLDVYICTGTADEKLEWFKIINIAGIPLTNQELRNAVYHGPWIQDAKKYFSKVNGQGAKLGGKYLKGSSIRQEYLEAVLNWISDGHIETYMAKHQFDTSARDLKVYFQNIVTWIENTFTYYRKEMKGLDYGYLYKHFKDAIIDPEELEKEIQTLMLDDDVTNKKGIYYYVLDRNPKWLNIRTFTPAQKRQVYEIQQGICAICGKHFEIEEMEADHITPWIEGGKTTVDNCQLLCKECNRKKGAK